MTNSKLRVSLVIPVYNEERHLALCLEAIAMQTVRPFEVIVVDNNSTDKTVEIARRYPFVTVLHESRQGVAYARECGFNAARGDIIGRTDGDGILAPNWVETVQALFTADPSIDAVSGVVGYRDVGFKNAFTAVDLYIRQYLSRRMSGIDEYFLYGINMAIRRRAWRLVRAGLCYERAVHEDIDLGIHLTKLQCNVHFTQSMYATISPRQAGSGPREFYKYVWSSPQAYETHGMESQRYLYPVALFVLSLYVPIRILYKGYNPATQRFSLRRALQVASVKRPSPVSETY